MLHFFPLAAQNTNESWIISFCTYGFGNNPKFPVEGSFHNKSEGFQNQSGELFTVLRVV